MKDDRVYLKDILDQVEIMLSEAGATSYEEFKNRPLWRNGMILSLIIIGEAAKRLSDEFKMNYPDFPISSLARTRDRLVHGYQGTDFGTVWEIITDDVPKLKRDVVKILDEMQ